MEENRGKLGNYEVVVYHLGDIFKTRDDRNKFVNETAGMLKSERENHYKEHFT